MSVLRLSGPGALDVARQVFSRNGKQRGQPWQAKTHRIYYGHIVDRAGTVVDEVTPRVCRAQHSLGSQQNGTLASMSALAIAQAAMVVSNWSATAAAHAGGWTGMKTSDHRSNTGAGAGHAGAAVVHGRGRGRAALPRRRRVRAPRAGLLPRRWRPPGAPRRVHAAGLSQRTPGPDPGETPLCRGMWRSCTPFCGGRPA